MLANIDAEQVVLGTILLSPGSSSMLVESLSLDDFVDQTHRLIFETIQAMVADGKAPSPVLLAPMVPEARGYLGKLLTSGVGHIMARDFAASLRDFSARRQMVAIADEMHAAALNVTASPTEFNIAAIQALDDLCVRARTMRSSMFHVGTIAHELVTKLKSGEKPDCVSTGLLDLDKVLGGLFRGQYVVGAGRPGMGKSAMICTMARQSAKKGVSWLIFSLEMKHEEVIARLVSDALYNAMTPIAYDRILKRELTPYEIERVENAARNIAELPIYVDDQVGLSSAEISIRARRHAEMLAKSGRRLDVIAVDHLGKVAASDRYAGQKVHETGEKSNAFMCLSRELNVSMFVAQQLNRGNEKRENRRAELSDLRDSGNIEEDAHVILLPFRLAYYLERAKEDDQESDEKRLAKLAECRNLIEINIGKNRNGPCRNIEFFCDMGCNAIRDLSR